MIEALLWGFVAASSLLIGAAVGIVWEIPRRTVGLILGFGAGALISAVSFDLALEGLRVGDAGATGTGLALGALAFYAVDGQVERRLAAGNDSSRKGGSAAGSGLALGALLDGIPEQLVLGISFAVGQGVSAALVVAIFVSNLPEAIGSSSDMRRAGRSRPLILKLWVAVAAICTLATGVGYAAGDVTSGNFQAGIDGFAAGALLVMLIDSLIPEAREMGGRKTGLATVLGFALAAGLSQVS